jgi:hypothetical protein
VRNMNPSHWQRGAASLVVALVILVAITLVTFGVANTMLMEERIAGNDVRGKQAFQAAQTGLDRVIAHLDAGNRPETLDLTTRVSLVDGTSYELLELDVLDYVMGLTGLRVMARGYSADETAVRTLTLERLPTIPVPAFSVQNPLTALGVVNVSGNASVVNPEGNFTVWSASPVHIDSSAAADTWVATPGAPPPAYPAVEYNCISGNSVSDTYCTKSSSASIGKGPDIIEVDPSLAFPGDQLFERLFSVPRDAFRETAVTMHVDPTEASDITALKSARNETIWIEGDLDLDSGTIGSPEAPVVLVVNGDLKMEGNTVVFGLIYVTGDWDGAGGYDVHGAVVLEGQVTGLGQGRIIFNSMAAAGAHRLSLLASMRVDAWRDWE